MHIYHHAYVNPIKVAFRCFKTIFKSFCEVSNFHAVLDQLFLCSNNRLTFFTGITKTAYLEFDRVIVKIKIELELK